MFGRVFIQNHFPQAQAHMSNIHKGLKLPILFGLFTLHLLWVLLLMASLFQFSQEFLTYLD